MRIIRLLAISALVLGAPVLTQDISLSDTGAAYAKGKGGDNGGGGKGGGNSKGGGKGASKGGKSDAKSKGQAVRSNGNGGGKFLKKLFGQDKKKAAATTKQKSKPKTTIRASGKPAVKAPGRVYDATAKKKPVSKAPTKAAPVKSPRPPKLPMERPKTLQAELKGLNSLKRNINGLMNSSDPKMDGFRNFVLASAAAATAAEALTTAEGVYAPLAETYAGLLEPLGLTPPTTQEEFDALSATLTGIADAPAPLEADYTVDGVLDTDAYNTALSAWSKDVTDATLAQSDFDTLYSAWSDVNTASTTLAEAEAATTDEALVTAIVDGMNATGAGPITAEDVSPEMFDWVSAEMGVGDDADGLIDDYIAQQTAQAAEGDASGDAEDDPDEDADDDAIEEVELIEDDPDAADPA